MLLSLMSSLASGEAADAARRAKRTFILLALAGVFALCALVFFVGAGFFATAEEVGLVEAALIFGAGFLILALIIYVILKILNRAQARKASKRRRSELLALGTTALAAALPSLLAGRRGSMALATPVLVALTYLVYRENTQESHPDDIRRKR